MFARQSLAQRFALPIHVVPHAIPAAPQPRVRANQPFTVLTMADSRSSFVRKNPAGAVRAFCQAFGPGDQARLIVKLNGKGVDRAELLGDAQAWPNIQVVDGFLDDDALCALYLSADVLLSLHRAEGFGLPMLEAMALGVPVVATAYSGNLDFMSEHSGMLVPARTVPVQDPTVYFRYGRRRVGGPGRGGGGSGIAPFGRGRRAVCYGGAGGLQRRPFARRRLATAAGIGRPSVTRALRPLP